MEQEIKELSLLRIDANEVLSIYKELDLQPQVQVFVSSDEKCVCGAGAIYLKKGKHMNVNHEISIGIVLEELLGYDYWYLSGFYSGFDGKEFKGENQRKKIGHEDGVASRNILIENGYTITDWRENINVD